MLGRLTTAAVGKARLAIRRLAGCGGACPARTNGCNCATPCKLGAVFAALRARSPTDRLSLRFGSIPPLLALLARGSNPTNSTCPHLS